MVFKRFSVFIKVVSTDPCAVLICLVTYWIGARIYCFPGKKGATTNNGDSDKSLFGRKAGRRRMVRKIAKVAFIFIFIFAIPFLTAADTSYGYSFDLLSEQSSVSGSLKRTPSTGHSRFTTHFIPMGRFQPSYPQGLLNSEHALHCCSDKKMRTQTQNETPRKQHQKAPHNAFLPRQDQPNPENET